MSRLAVILLLFVSACATTSKEVADACDSYAADEVAVVFRIYDDYDQNGFAPGMVTQAREAVEHARTALHSPTPVPDTPVCSRKHRRSSTWKDLADDLEVADALVVELESARGVRFVTWNGSSGEWVDSTTGKPVPEMYAGSL